MTEFQLKPWKRSQGSNKWRLGTDRPPCRNGPWIRLSPVVTLLVGAAVHDSHTRHDGISESNSRCDTTKVPSSACHGDGDLWRGQNYLHVSRASYARSRCQMGFPLHRSPGSEFLGLPLFSQRSRFLFRFRFPEIASRSGKIRQAWNVIEGQQNGVSVLICDSVVGERTYCTIIGCQTEQNPFKTDTSPDRVIQSGGWTVLCRVRYLQIPWTMGIQRLDDHVSRLGVGSVCEPQLLKIRLVTTQVVRRYASGCAAAVRFALIGCPACDAPPRVPDN